MLKIKSSTKFKKELKKFQHKQSVINELNTVLEMLQLETPLPSKYKDHPLIGNWVGRRECHIKPDVLLIYKIEDGNLILERINSHSELFK